ncbi:hypothetical protein Glove_120g195 [Diversispora epigaea]|uniref:Uncharacterized protein n=1 Tax=Diversispora epigaea TaxID=1348612 RepID=A0A397J3G4_9GLOM|nr:hypothetical protein Glove_120g195 [Diversispora epigaea]
MEDPKPPQISVQARPGKKISWYDRVGNNFRWPSSMPEYLKRDAFINIADVPFEADDEVGFNLLFFYDAFDKGEFAGHEHEWVTMHKQKVIEYGSRYDDDKLSDILEALPGTIQIPVDQTQLPRVPPAKIVTVQRAIVSKRYFKVNLAILQIKIKVRVKRPGENLIVQLECDFYDIAYNNKKYQYEKGGEYNQTNSQSKDCTLGRRTGNQAQYALVGNDITDQLAYAHESSQPMKFIDLRDEPRLAQFLMGCV